jgi:hypothetical protein
MQKAWIVAKAGARRFGGAARAYLAAAMRQVWREEKAARAARATSRVRVAAELVRIRAEAAERAAMPRQPAWTGYVPSFARRAPPRRRLAA